MKFCGQFIALLVAFISFVECAPSTGISHRKKEHRKNHKASPLIGNNESDGEEYYRCGFSDIVKEGGRQKRYALLGSKWEKFDLTWAYDNKNSKFAHDKDKIRRLISEATKVWAGSSVLKFQEVSDIRRADILVSFEGEDHRDVDEYPMRGSTLAHAFPPGSGLGGDIHIRDNLEWDLDVMYGDRPVTGKLSFFAAVLHEMGHSLGLQHTDLRRAVMYPSIHASTGVLDQDDSDGIQHIYGVPRSFVKPEHNHEPSPPIETPVAAPADIPDKCKTSFDAAVRLRGELFMFKSIYCWRPEVQADAIEIRTIWKELPETLTHVDAVFVNHDNKIWFFIGREVFVFRATKFESKMTLRDLGIDESRYSKIDAIFTWQLTGRTFIFSGDDYWRFEGMKVDRNYPKAISSAWRDVYDIDTVLTDGDHLYFFKGVHLYEFDTRRMRIDRMKPLSIGSKMMECPQEPEHTMDSRFDDDSDPDVIFNWKPDEIPEDEDNIEKMQVALGQTGRSSASSKIASVQLFLSLIVAFLFASEFIDWCI